MYDLKVLYCGSITADESFHFYGHPMGNVIASPSFYYLLEKDGNKYLIDTGFDSPEIIKKNLGMKTEIVHPMRELLSLAGTSPEEIKAIVFTHLHWDHMGNIGEYKNAELFVQADELKWALNPPAWAAGYNGVLAKNLVAVKDRFHAIEGDIEVLPGIHTVKTGGHSYGSQCIIVETDKGRIALPGDVIARYRNFEQDVPAGLIVDLQQAIDALPKIKAASDIILPSHDWLVFDHWSGIIGGPEGK